MLQTTGNDTTAWNRPASWSLNVGLRVAKARFAKSDTAYLKFHTITSWWVVFRMWTLHFHPWWPRGSQSGWEKRQDESFQVWAKEPLGTDSHRTISKNSSGCRLLIGPKKCFVLLCPISEQFLLISFREFVHDGYCLVTLARFFHQASACKGNFYFLLS